MKVRSVTGVTNWAGTKKSLLQMVLQQALFGFAGFDCCQVGWL